MGKGDRKSKKGKIFRSSFGKSRPKKDRNKPNYTGSEMKVAVKKSEKQEEE